MDILEPVFGEQSGSFAITFREHPVYSLVVLAIGPLVMAFGEARGSLFYGGLVLLAAVAMVLATVRRVRFDKDSRTLTVERGWGLRKTAYDMNLLDTFRIVRVKGLLGHEYRCRFSVRHGDGKREEETFGPFRTDGVLVQAAEILERALGRPVLTV